MKILNRYILSSLLRNLGLSLLVFILLYLTIDFLDRVDNLVNENADLGTSLLYFLLKIPLATSLMLPVAMLVATLFTVGILAKNSEITAMRASGITVMTIARPILLTGLVVSFFSILVNETAVPYSARRVKEIYNIDIRQKDKSGGYSQSNLWWRDRGDFLSASMFDSRNNSLVALSRFSISDDFEVSRRTDAKRVTWLGPEFRWSMHEVTEFRFDRDRPPEIMRFRSLPLTIGERPDSFYNVETEPDTMSFYALRRFIKKQAANGIQVRGYLADLNEKIAFPFLNFIIVMVVLPFVVRSTRGSSLAAGVIAALVIGFSYYAVHSFSIALGRAEIWPPVLAAWMANILLGIIGIILSAGAESPG